MPTVLQISPMCCAGKIFCRILKEIGRESYFLFHKSGKREGLVLLLAQHLSRFLHEDGEFDLDDSRAMAAAFFEIDGLGDSAESCQPKLEVIIRDIVWSYRGCILDAREIHEKDSCDCCLIIKIMTKIPLGNQSPRRKRTGDRIIYKRL